MKRIALLVIVLLLLGYAHGEEFAQKLIDASGVDAFDDFASENEGAFSWDGVRDFLQGEDLPDLNSTMNLLGELAAQPAQSVLKCISTMAFPVLLLAVLGCGLPGRKNGGAAFACRILLYGNCIQLMKIVLDVANHCLRITASFSDTAVPVLAAVLTAGGLSGTAGLITPAAALAGGIIQSLFLNVGLPVCGCTSCLGLAGNLTCDWELNRLTKLIRRLINWGCGLTVMLFTSLVSLKGNMMLAADNLALKTAKYAVDSATSVIGNGVSDAWESYLAGLSVAKNVVGVSGTLALLSVCFRPLLLIGTAMLCLTVVSVFLEMTGEKPAAKAFEQLCGVCRMCLTLCGGAVAVWIILLGATLSLGRSM